MKIDNVPDQSRLVAFLKKIDLSEGKLFFQSGCNLDQDFFDELPSYLSINHIYFYADVFYRFTDYTFLSKLNLRKINFTFNQLPYQVVWNILNNPSVTDFQFYKLKYSRYKDASSHDHLIGDIQSSAGLLKDGKMPIDRIEKHIRNFEIKLETKFT